jgi:hypothetical protein
MAAPAPKRRALGGGRGLAALVAGARAKRAEINLLDEEEDDVDGGGGAGGRIGVATTAAAAAATMEKPSAPASQPSATPAAIRPALFYGESLPRPPLHAGHQLATPGSAPVLANPNAAAFRSSGVPLASAALAAGMKTR